MPIPATTTRLMSASSAAASPSARLHRHVVPEQADLEVECPIDHGIVGRKPPVSNTEHKLGSHHALDVDPIDYFFHRRQDLAGELDLAKPERAPSAGSSEPAQEEPEQLPERIEAQAPRHDGITLEMAVKEPQVRPKIEHRAHQAF